MPNTFFIGDTHFGHENIIVFEAIKPYRPFTSIQEHDEELVKRWNSVVRKGDIVWHLGDFCFGRENLAIAARLNGEKRLVLGNHDHCPTEDYLLYFNKLYGCVKWEGKLLTHIPVVISQLDRRFNVHAHLHTHLLDDRRYINVSVEQINLTPISLEEINARI